MVVGYTQYYQCMKVNEDVIETTSAKKSWFFSKNYRVFENANTRHKNELYSNALAWCKTLLSSY